MTPDKEGLRRILDRRVMTAVEMAAEAGCKTSHIYKSASPEEPDHHLAADRWCALAIYEMAEYGSTTLVESILPPMWAPPRPPSDVRLDGSAEDEIRAITLRLGQVIDRIDGHDTAAAIKAATELRRQADQLVAELKLTR